MKAVSAVLIILVILFSVVVLATGHQTSESIYIPMVDRVTTMYKINGEDGVRVLIPTGPHTGIYTGTEWTPTGDVFVEGTRVTTAKSGRLYVYDGTSWVTHGSSSGVSGPMCVHNGSVMCGYPDGEYYTLKNDKVVPASVMDGNVISSTKLEIEDTLYPAFY